MVLKVRARDVMLFSYFCNRTLVETAARETKDVDSLQQTRFTAPQRGTTWRKKTRFNLFSNQTAIVDIRLCLGLVLLYVVSVLSVRCDAMPLPRESL